MPKPSYFTRKKLKSLTKQRDNLRSQVEDLAYFNYSREPQIVKERLQLSQNIEEVSNLRNNIINNRLQQLILILDESTEHTKEQVKKLENESEQIANQFLNNSIDHDNFSQLYIEARKKAHMKIIMADGLVKKKTQIINAITNDKSVH